MNEEPTTPRCCAEGDCHRARPFLFTKTPDNRWLLITRWKMLEEATKGSGAQVEVLERHDVTPQLDAILSQYRAFLDEQLTEAMTLQAEHAAAVAEKEAQTPKLYLPGDGS
jgi:hypothetical protein